MKEKTVCFECGAVLTEGISYTLDGKTMCEDCFERLLVITVIQESGEIIQRGFKLHRYFFCFRRP